MDRSGVVVGLVVVLATLSGCSIDVSLGGQTATPAPSAGRWATVTAVVDADTVDVRFDDGTTDRVRLLGVDAPETYAENAPREFEGVPDTQRGERCLRQAGERASSIVRDRIEGDRVRVVTDPVADRRGSFDRLLAYLHHEERNLNEWLLSEGHARLYDSRFSRIEAFSTAETAAMDAGRGVWDCRDGVLGTTSPVSG